MTPITLLPGSKEQMSKSHRVPGGKTEEKVGVPLGAVLAGLVEQPHSRLACALQQGWSKKPISSIKEKHQGWVTGAWGSSRFPEQGKRLQEEGTDND